ncbi:MAG: HindVP family restriction endonuclease, partial [Prevotellaceae bacterium]|nr:HindVP family restriction endonuclease [Prevotellaceae bacterium]
MEVAATKPGLFGQKHSSRDYTKPNYWGKNQFNSSFPASLVAYMSSKSIPLVYLHTDKKNKLTHSHITAERVFGIDPLSDKAYYNFEAGFPPYEQYYKGDREKTDLVMMDRETGKPLCGLEVKLTALPDNSTKSEPEERYGCE